MNKFSASQRIGEIVANFPAAADVLKEYRIDFCCGGDRLLATVIQEQGLNMEEILDKINFLYDQFKDRKSLEVDWTKESLNRLVDHILNNHHVYLQVELPKISELTTKILRVHGLNHPELATVHRLFHNLKIELDQHLIKEEVIEFPLIKEWEKNPSQETLEKAVNVILELEREHVGAGDILKELRRVTNDYFVPADGCNTFRLAYQKLEEMENNTFQHIHLENNILFQRLKEKE